MSRWFTIGALVARKALSTPSRLRKASAADSKTCVDSVSRGNVACSTSATDSPARAREYAAVLRDQTGGNPFFLRETWRDIVARGGAAQVRPSTPLAPVSIRDTLQRRLSRLALHEREVLETAAVLGDGGAVRSLVAACGDDPGEALAALDTAAPVRAGGRRGADQGTRRLPAYASPGRRSLIWSARRGGRCCTRGSATYSVGRDRLLPGGAWAGLSFRAGQRAGLRRQGRGVPRAVGSRGRAEPGF